MRPFLPLSLPEIPSYTDFVALVSLKPAEPKPNQNFKATDDGFKEQALSMLDIADQAMRVARKEWEAMSKMDARTARCLGCEEWWRNSTKNVVRACIAANIAVATARRGLMASRGKSAEDVLRVEIPDPVKNYHAWWLVPSVSMK